MPETSVTPSTDTAQRPDTPAELAYPYPRGAGQEAAIQLTACNLAVRRARRHLCKLRSFGGDPGDFAAYLSALDDVTAAAAAARAAYAATPVGVMTGTPAGPGPVAGSPLMTGGGDLARQFVGDASARLVPLVPQLDPALRDDTANARIDQKHGDDA